jgi:hypothetical protein
VPADFFIPRNQGDKRSRGAQGQYLAAGATAITLTLTGQSWRQPEGQTMSNRLIITWKDLQAMGWPYSRTHTWRLMKPTLRKSSGSKWKGTYKEWEEPNPNPFPRCRNFFKHHRSCRVVWPYAEVIAYFEKNGIPIRELSVTFEVA